MVTVAIGGALGFKKRVHSCLCVVTDIDLKYARAGLVLCLILVVLSLDH